MEIDFGQRYPCKSCGSTRGLSYLPAKDDMPMVSYCHSCQETVSNPLDPDVKIIPKKQVRHDNIIETIKREYPIQAIEDRGISLETAKHFGIRVGISQANGQDISEHYYPRELDENLVGWHVKVVEGEKRFYNLLQTTEESDSGIERQKEADFFGTKRARRGDRFILIITEGPTDMGTLDSALVEHRRGGKYQDRRVAVVSTPDGVGSLVKTLLRQRDFIESYKKVVLCMDQDKPGQDAVDKATQLMREWNVEVTVAKFSEKDPGDMYKTGKVKELVEACLYNATKPRPSGSASKADMIRLGMEEAEMGIPLPYPTLNDKVYGIQKRAVIGIGAGVGVGKSTMMNDIIKHMVDLKYKPGIFYFEESVGDAMKMFASRFLGKDLMDPNVKVPAERRQAALTTIADQVQLATEDVREWEDVRELITEWILAHDLNPIILDPISNITPANVSLANEFLNQALGDLTHIAKSHNVGVVITSHLNKVESGPPHEEGGRVQENHFTGSAAMRRWCKVILGIERNKQATGEIPKNNKIDEMLHTPGISAIRVLKNRVGRWTGPIYVKYSTDTMGYTEL